MNPKFSFMLLISACAPQDTPTAAVDNPADRFAGTWTGTMRATDNTTLQAVAVVTIPTGCSSNDICGRSINTANGCQWELTLEAVHGDVFEYTYSNTLEGECPALGRGTLTLNSDGTLFREHKFPEFAMSGTLTRQSAQSNQIIATIRLTR